MILVDILRENEVTISKKGVAAMAKAFKDIYPNLESPLVSDEDLVGVFLTYELPEAEALKVLQLTAKYAGLWAFA